MKRPSHFTLWQIFAVPLVVGIVSSLGLVFALVGDGWWDGLSWAALGVPVALYVLFMVQRKPR
jgi:hypothetical protein